ncbi:hypothetical protein G6M87_11060 [Rhizobium rhizogenes]|uniref:hypothetical protein n=1 Tax=Rhizobium rhizogenes TaxID=359 RepID=UPI0015725A01|nr:hypothetical protein [Rhizobium rhizogenes]NTI22397.1 hypothetical protein [Rhizobium rhizogenes]QTG05982.1 hypothetical protein G6M87_11060 [Rhizobium rhizogenes]
MITDARYFMLHGWARFLGSSNNDNLMKQITKRRKGGNWGIAINDDYFALQWQRYDFRRQRAQRAIGADKIRSYSFTGTGPLSLRLAGANIPGWETDPEAKAVEADTARMQERRLKAKRACELLRTMAEPYDVRDELGRLDYEEACRDAMGY